MFNRSLYRFAIVIFLAAPSSLVRGDDDVDFFEANIRPVLVDKCFECHSAKSDSLKGGLRVDTKDGLLHGGDSGPAVVPNDPEQSLILQALSYDDCFYQMPPDGKLDDQIVDNFRNWIVNGAVDPRTDAEKKPAAPEATGKADVHWAFVAPVVQAIDCDKQLTKNLEETGWIVNRVDSYVLEQLSKRGLEPSAVADERTLVRRLYFDLAGLPPSFDDVQRFVASTDEHKYESLVDDLLAREQFGERWARYWLDVARFADTKGYVFTEKRDYPDAHKYRDWVINSFNNDLPFDQFVRLQLAADRLAESRDDSAQLSAMGFLTLGRRFLNNQRDIIDDRIDVVTRGLMGLTVTCARCHDHKYDPIPMEDYYSLFGVFSSSEEPGGEPSPLRMVDKANPADAPVLIRGSRRGEIVPRRFLKVLSTGERQPFRNGSGRLELAEKIASPQNPLTARVFVNRVWAHLMGDHLVNTPSDFGVRSDLPAHQKLLDYLAVDFMESGWSTKSLIRNIVLSRTYRQQSLDRTDAVAVDPENALYWKANRRRLDFEALRDAMLKVADHLDETVGGPSAKITGKDPSNRRTLYAFVDRQNFPGLFRAFDVASPDTHAPKRFQTTVPQQSLYLMNHDFPAAMSDRVATTLSAVKDDAGSVELQNGVSHIYRKVLGREPTSSQLTAICQTLFGAGPESHTDSKISAEDARWSQLAHVLLMSNEFTFLD
ncbi:MAG: PSD1 domain-containing protein [Planctomycetales bacterium]|nr:PSD1 domain-containing protein [Planctomycetales bacterium]